MVTVEGPASKTMLDMEEGPQDRDSETGASPALKEIPLTKQPVISAVVVKQPAGPAPTPKKVDPVVVTAPAVVSPGGYQVFKDAAKRKLFGMPFLMVPPEQFGLINFIMQCTSFASFVLSFALSPYGTLESQILFCLVYHVMVSWVLVPVWQNYSLLDAEKKPVSCEANGCIYCACCYIGCNLCWLCGSQMHYVERTDSDCRYMPFSLYNLLYMFLNPGQKINEQLPADIEALGFGRVYLFLLSCNTKGTLNLYIFINAVAKLYAAGGNGTSAAFATISLLLALCDLKVYAVSLVFGIVLFPFTIMYLSVFCCPDCCRVLDALRVKKDTFEFRVMMHYWKYVDKY